MMKDQKLWTWHVGAGAVIAVLLGLHMLTMHIDGLIPIRALNVASDHRAVDWVNVVARGKSAAFAITYVLLLGAALFHGLYGLRNILFELNPSAGLKKAVGALLLLAGLGLFAFGTWAALASHALAKAL
jgi:succinate dehydrogenase hydrophobic anchor subunit